MIENVLVVNREVGFTEGFEVGYTEGTEAGYAEGRADMQAEIADAIQAIADACHVSQSRPIVAAYLRAARIARGVE